MNSSHASDTLSDPPVEEKGEEEEEEVEEDTEEEEVGEEPTSLQTLCKPALYCRHM